MNKADLIVIHCSATKENDDYTVENLERDHLRRGFSGIGYHVYIRRDGNSHLCRPLNKKGAHVKGFNAFSWGICYEGGLDKNGKAKDTRTEHQKQAILRALLFLKGVSPGARIQGHRDCSPDLNGDGIVSPDEYIKQCPCFDAGIEYKNF